MKLLMENFRNFTTKQLLTEENLAGMTITEILELLKEYGQRTWVVFDTETLGFDPLKHQLTEIAAIALDPRGWESEPEEVGQFHKKVKLQAPARWRMHFELKKDPFAKIESVADKMFWNDFIQSNVNAPKDERGRKWLAHFARYALAEKKKAEAGHEPGKKLGAHDLLKMTGYFAKDSEGNMLPGIEEAGVDYIDEQQAMKEFYDFVNSFGDPVMCAQNASFDMKMVNTRYQGEIPRYRVFDTMMLFQLFLIPALQSLGDQGDEEALRKLEMLKTRFGFSSSLGKVRDVYEVTGDWHSAIADVRMTIEVTGHVIRELKANPDLDIEQHHAKKAASLHRRKVGAGKKEKAAKTADEIDAMADTLIQYAADAGKDLSQGDAIVLAKNIAALWKMEKEIEKKGRYFGKRQKRGWKQKAKEKFRQYQDKYAKQEG